MAEHPIEKLMDTAMSNIKSMVDVNTIVGDAVETVDGSVIIPISKVSFGFAAGGGEMDDERSEEMERTKPFAGGSGAGVMLNPMAFLVVKKDQVRLLPVSNNAVAERLVNIAPEIMKEVKEIMGKRGHNRHPGSDSRSEL